MNHAPGLDGPLLRYEKVTHVLPLGGNVVTKRRLPLRIHLSLWWWEATGWLLKVLRLCKHQGGMSCSSVDYVTRCGRCRAPMPAHMQMCGRLSK